MILHDTSLVYIATLIILCISFLFFVGLGGALTAYARNWLFNDSTALDEGFGSINPLQHIYELTIPLFIWLGVIIKKPQPAISSNHEKSFKGYLSQLAAVILSFFIYIGLATLCLLIGFFIWKETFIPLAFRVSLTPSVAVIQLIKELFSSIKGYSIIAMLLMLYGISVNITLAILDLFISVVNFFIQRYFIEHATNISFLIFFNILAVIAFIAGRNILLIICWKIILFPIKFLL